jgi:branched-chain amino acid transport system substrate-binding protein
MPLLVSILVLGLAGAARAADDEVRIGVILPLTGAAASTGLELRNSIELAADLVNAPVKDLPFPHLRKGKLTLVFADHQGNPQIGASEAERLITQEHVAALIGCYFSAVTATASQVAERHGIPFVNADSTSSTLTQRGFKWFFRTTPHDELFVQNFFSFLKDVQARKKVALKKLALFNENTLWGSETTKLEEKIGAQQGYTIAERILYPAKSTQLTSEVQRIQAANADVVLQSSYLGDAVLAMRTYKELGYTPPALLANDAGFNDSEFLKTVGKDGEYVLSREVWALDLAQKKPLIKRTNDLMMERYKVNFNGNTARNFTALMVLADAIDRAGSAAPEEIRTALRATSIPADKLIMPWDGIHFDATGQNEKGAGIIVQVQDGKYVTVWPFSLASKEVIWPMPDWSKR